MNKLYEESNISAIASAIRSKLGVQTQFTIAQMAAAVGQIHGEPVLESIVVNQNGTFTHASDKDGISQIIVNVPEEGIGDIYAFAKIYHSSEDTVSLRKGNTVRAPLETINGVSYFIIPESGQWTFYISNTPTEASINANTKYSVYSAVAAYKTSPYMIFITDYTDGMQAKRYTYGGRSGNLNAAGRFVGTRVQYNNGYICGVYCSLNNYQNAPVTGSYINKMTILLTNPDDPNEQVTVYCWGSIDGCYKNVAVNFYGDTNNALLSIAPDAPFSIPYSSSSSGTINDTYDIASIDDKRALWTMLQATIV